MSAAFGWGPTGVLQSCHPHLTAQDVKEVIEYALGKEEMCWAFPAWQARPSGRFDRPCKHSTGSWAGWVCSGVWSGLELTPASQV